MDNAFGREAWWLCRGSVRLGGSAPQNVPTPVRFYFQLDHKEIWAGLEGAKEAVAIL